MKRIILFLVTNLAVMILLSIIARLLGLVVTPVIATALVFGMAGSFISLAMSKWIAKMSTGAQVIETPSNRDEQWLLDTVQRQAQQAGIQTPEVAIYDSPEVNAFATGMSRNNALVAVSTGLLQSMSRDEVEAVLAHEVSHAANGDMVTLALIQGVVNTFVILLARLAASVVSGALSSNSDNEENSSSESTSGIVYFLVSMVAEIIFGILAMPIVMYFSRVREYAADKGAAQLAGKHKMIAALQRLQQMQGGTLPDQLTAFGINNGHGQGLIQQLFASHPALEDRIAALQAL